MRLIHTSDWHLGKSLEGFSRIEEQKKFCEEFIDIVEKNEVDFVIIAGDIYDNSNPSATAEFLFYDTISRLSDKGRRCVFIISGNHDNPDRLESISPLIKKSGIIVLGYPLSHSEVGKYRGFEILEVKKSFTKLRIKDEVVNIISLPYPSEKRLNEAFSAIESTEENQREYSEKIGEMFKTLEKNFSDDEINIATSHLFVAGSEITDSERRIELGGSLLVEKNMLPEKSQYTALGHIHKPQMISKKFNAYYSGSPLQYSKSESGFTKSVNLVELSVGSNAKVKTLHLNNYKPINIFRCKGVDEAIKICEENRDEDIYSYFEIETQEVISQENIKRMKENMKSIVEIRPIINLDEEDEIKEVVDISRTNIGEYFVDFYKKENDGISPSDSVLDLFNKLVELDERGVEDETD